MRTLVTILIASTFVLLLILTIEAAGIGRSPRRIEHEERRLVTQRGHGLWVDGSQHDVGSYPRLLRGTAVSQNASSPASLSDEPDGSVTTAGTADVETVPKWCLMLPPFRSNNWDTKAAFSRWTKIKAFPTENECHERAVDALQEYNTHGLGDELHKQGVPAAHLFIDTSTILVPEVASLRCIASDDPRFQEKIAGDRHAR